MTPDFSPIKITVRMCRGNLIRLLQLSRISMSQTGLHRTSNYHFFQTENAVFVPEGLSQVRRTRARFQRFFIELQSLGFVFLFKKQGAEPVVFDVLW